ncbi:DNA/RNA non-specific endonuclease [Sphingobacterium oryzagri]|uniref:DNA/RNA non-specific endonuclease n=1 Tax=Sphingobacterium oryzagri TaxID=3025669 RepID=A0ABY7WDJ5_9SPHI|nr:DNA/RNA non-specific endonuclease [Sphingobacterium sp. KACC 22765]WDF67577.1 DNA/RNA non-specific endonuclease [Sphingobacterium sp. KACC 22765]
MKFRRRLCVYALCLIGILSSCRKETDGTASLDELQFQTVVSTTASQEDGQRLSQTQSVGLFMTRSGQNLQADHVLQGVDNKRFITDASGIFRSENLSVQYPANAGTAFDIIAYAPFRRQLDNYRYIIDLNDQSQQESLDFMVADNLMGITRGEPLPRLVFQRQLAKIQINVNTASGESATGLRVALQGMRTEGVFDFGQKTLSSSSNSIRDIQAKVTPLSANQALIETTIFPVTTTNGQRFVFTLQNGVSYTWTLPVDSTYHRAARYVYNITLQDGDGSIAPVAPPRIYFETPELTHDGQRTLYITHMMPENNAIRNYSMLYDTQYKMAYWVAYPMHASYLGTSGRTDAWAYDPLIGTTNQPTLLSGFGLPNVDRGHQIASADRTSSVRANATTFYYSNMTPQQARLNQGLWANLENRVRGWINRTDTLYVVTGAMATSSSDPAVQYVSDNTGVQVAVPKYYYKALAARQGNNYETIAFKVDNVQPVNNDFIQHRITVEELERETGFRFFPTIPNSAKQTINMAFWQ